MNLEDIERRCREFARERLSDADAAHDLAHVRRVVAQARKLADEENARAEIVLPAAWLHDCVVVAKDYPDRARASTLAARDATDFLSNLGIAADDLPEIAHAIEAHSFSAGIEPRTLEAQIVRDADRLDALGAIGIARLFLTGGTMGSALHHPDEPFPERRTIDDRRWAIDHFYAKLLSLESTFTTPSARREARRRTQFLQTYLDQLAAELDVARA